MTTAYQLRMSDTETIKFLELYRDENALWDPTNRLYQSREARLAACQTIADKMNLSEFTARHVVIKFKNLRSSYSQELKKIAKSRSTAGSSKDVYEPRVFWFSLMDGFLKPHVTSRQTKMKHDMSNIIEHESTQDISSTSENDEEKYSIESPVTEVQLTEKKPAKRKIFCESESGVPKISKKISGESCSTNEIATVLGSLDKMSRRNSAVKLPTSGEDCFDHFGKYIASVLRTFTMEKALEVQGEMINLLLQAHTTFNYDYVVPSTSTNNRYADSPELKAQESD